MNRTTAISFGLAGVLALLIGALYTFFDPVYYDATSFIDYAAVGSLAVLGVANGTALILLWRDPPVARGSLFILFAGIAAVTQGVGDLLEDAFGIEDAVWAWFGGGTVLLLSLLIAGIAALTVPWPQRWSGLFLLVAAPGALVGPVGLEPPPRWELRLECGQGSAWLASREAETTTRSG